MFDIGFGELLLIAIVALVVLGPERLPKAARFAGLWVRRARAQWHSVRDELERELAADELKRSLRDTQDAVRDTERRIRESAAETARQFDDLRQSVQDGAPAANAAEPAPEPVEEAPLASAQDHAVSENADADTRHSPPAAAERPSADAAHEPRNT